MPSAVWPAVAVLCFSCLTFCYPGSNILSVASQLLCALTSAYCCPPHTISTQAHYCQSYMYIADKDADYDCDDNGDGASRRIIIHPWI